MLKSLLRIKSDTKARPAWKALPKAHAPVLFRAARAIERALIDIRDGVPMPKDDSVDFDGFEAIVDKEKWSNLEKRFGKGG